MNEEQQFNTYLRERMHAANLTASELAEASGVSESQIEALLKGAFQKLPSVPYVRGYLIHIARALGLEKEDLWTRYKEQADIKSSGPLDLLPTNRFAIRSIRRGWIAGAAAALLILIYLGVNAARLFGTPRLTLDYPLFETEQSAEEIVALKGTIDPDDKLTIDGNEVTVDSEGRFALEYPLKQGLNRVEFKVKRILGKEITVARQIVYQPEAGTPPAAP